MATNHINIQRPPVTVAACLTSVCRDSNNGTTGKKNNNNKIIKLYRHP